MERRVFLEKKGRKPGEIKRMRLDECESLTIVGLNDDFRALEILSIANVGLRSLTNFPVLPNLIMLNLSENKLNDDLELLLDSPKLKSLDLRCNLYEDFQDLKPLEEFEHLEMVYFWDNEIALDDNYKKNLFELIPSLKYLDNLDKNGDEADPHEVALSVYYDPDEEVDPGPQTEESEGEEEERLKNERNQTSNN